MPRPRLRAYEQGHLDGLCGLYSIVNAIQFAFRTVKRRERGRLYAQERRLNDQDVEDLFVTLFSSLVRAQRRARFIIEGINDRQLSKLLRLTGLWLRRSTTFTLTIKRLNRRAGRVGPKTLMRHINDHLALPGTAVIVGANPPWRHWTVAIRVARSRLYLLDSGGRPFVPLKRGQRSRYHVGLIAPSDVYLVTIGPYEPRRSAPPKALAAWPAGLPLPCRPGVTARRSPTDLPEVGARHA
jgi:hypothetical protein